MTPFGMQLSLEVVVEGPPWEAEYGPSKCPHPEFPRLWICHLIWLGVLADVIKIKNLEMGGDSGIPRWARSNDVRSSRLEGCQRSGSEGWGERRTPLRAAALRMEEEDHELWACRSWDTETCSFQRESGSQLGPAP